MSMLCHGFTGRILILFELKASFWLKIINLFKKKKKEFKYHWIFRRRRVRNSSENSSWIVSFELKTLITELYNHGMAWGGRDLKDLAVPTPATGSVADH